MKEVPILRHEIYFENERIILKMILKDGGIQSFGFHPDDALLLSKGLMNQFIMHEMNSKSNSVSDIDIIGKGGKVELSVKQGVDELISMWMPPRHALYLSNSLLKEGNLEMDRITCECGQFLSKQSQKKHLETKKHNDRMELKKEVN